MNPPDAPPAAASDPSALSGAGAATAREPLLPQLAAAAAFVVAYVGLEWVSFVHEHEGLPVTPWNPGLGLALAVMILGGPRYGLALFAGIAMAEIVLLQTNLPWPAIVAVATIISAGYALVAGATRRRLRLEAALPRLRDVFVLLAAAVAGALGVSLLLIAFLLAFGHIGGSDVVLAAGTFIVGDLIGIAVVTPLLLRLADGWRRRTLHGFLPPLPDAVLLGLAIAAVLAVVAVTETSDGSKFFYLLFAPVVIAAVRHGLDGACLGLAVTQLGLVGLLHVQDYEARVFTEFQTLMLVLTATGLVVGAVVSERHAADRAVRDAEAKLREKEAEAAQAARFMLVSSMASALAHEINQPLTAMRALARSVQHLLKAPDADLPRAERNLGTMIAHIDHMGGVVGHMRDFLRRGRPHVSSIDVAAMVGSALTLVRATAGAQNVRLTVDLPADLPTLHGDRIQLEQVLLNLVRNAIDALSGARREDGEVRIAVRHDAGSGRLEIAVGDNGPGVPPADAARLFEPLRSSKQEGLGLGLPICVSIVEAHGGRIWLASGEPGRTEFRLSLPLDPARAP